MKKLIALLLLVALSTAVPAFAAENGNGSNGYNGNGYNGNGYNGNGYNGNGYNGNGYNGNGYYQNGHNENGVNGNGYNGTLTYVSKEGYIEAYTEQETGVSVISRDGQSRVILLITENTQIVDAYTAQPGYLANRETDRVIVYYGPVVTRSEPPQSNAALIIFNVPEWENGYNGQNGYNGYPNGYNGQNGYNGYENGYHQQPTVPYTTIPPNMTLADALGRVYTEFYTENNITMVPLRQVAESMGFNVTWDETNRAVTLHHYDGQSFGTIVIGQSSFEGRYMEAAPSIRNDRTFVPVSFFEILLGM